MTQDNTREALAERERICAVLRALSAWASADGKGGHCELKRGDVARDCLTAAAMLGHPLDGEWAFAPKAATEATAEEPAAVPTDDQIDALVDQHYRTRRHPDNYGALRAFARDVVALAAQGTQKAEAVPVAEIIDANAGCNCLYERRIPKWLDGTPPVGTKLYATPQKAEATQAAAPTEDDIDTELAEHEVALTTEQRGGVHAAFRDLLAASQQGGRT